MSARDSVIAAVNTVEETMEPEQVNQVLPDQHVPIPDEPIAPKETAPIGETQEQKTERIGRTAGRPRDEQGRLLPGKPVKDATPPATLSPPPSLEGVVPVVAATKPRPSSWKKDFDQHWEKFDPSVQEYILQRESEFAKGVSTYKAEYENVKPLVEAMQPFMQTLKQYNIQPAQWINNLGNAHHKLALGSPQDKLQMFAQLAQEYKVPLQALYDPQAAQNFMQQQVHQPAPQPVQQADPRQLVREEWESIRTEQAIKDFSEAKDATGQPKYPHYDTVKPTMAQLLESGLANDLPSAYDKAIRMHDDLWQQQQDSTQQANTQARLQQQAKQVAAAKANAVSTRSATPAQQGAPAKKGTTGDYVAAAFDAHTEGGRV